ncbi:GntR family transcriptional regulator [Streptomyces sp. NEAU-Y11]|uniref:GntR family transcriptional regulator n=1 Tax=Streptomyces cucumeris TaxID=2962890 RepID=UPI0020C8BF06|nr:GntR family transcriptional regulator [Streptomyces sp. NEAU-Y11]MCP9206734.1 GntR family transcriptional regulator [Streptomyces sp. NEAU-Y11]
MADNSWATRLPKVKSKAELVHDTLRQAIADGDLRPGQRINMDELSRNLGVSKIPVREAVKRLESEGLVTSQLHAGVIVSEVDKTEMRGVFLAREAIEALAAQLATERVDDALLAELERVQTAMRTELDRGATDRLPELNSEFHHILSSASGYRILAELTEQLLMTIRRYRITAPRDDKNWRSVVAEHDAIVEALRARDAEAAAAAARAHTTSQAGHEMTAND